MEERLPTQQKIERSGRANPSQASKRHTDLCPAQGVKHKADADDRCESQLGGDDGLPLFN